MNPFTRDPLKGQSKNLLNLADVLAGDAALLFGDDDRRGIMASVAEASTVLRAIGGYARRLEEVDAIEDSRAAERDEIKAERAAARAPRPAAAGPRHKFGPDGTCVAVHGTDGKVCGAAKGRRGRPPAVQPDGACSVGGEHKKSQDPASPFCIKCGGRVFSLALPLGDAAADKFEGGGLGSSGVRR